MDIAPRVELNNPLDAEKYLKMGVKHFCLGTDVTTIYNWGKENGSLMRDMLKGV